MLICQVCDMASETVVVVVHDLSEHLLNSCFVYLNDLVISVSASHVVGHGFVPRQGHTKDHHKYKLPPFLAHMR